MPRRFWVGVVSRNHVRLGVQGGFAQVCHGKRTALARWRKGDVMFYYSPKPAMESKEPYQKFTAVGFVQDDAPFQVEQFPGFCPFRRQVDYIGEAREAEIRPLIDQLSFIKNKDKWGGVFRFGMVEITEADARLIASSMGVSLDQQERAEATEE